jgi:ubiquinol-cytochrome c reductase cytochrome c subunit
VSVRRRLVALALGAVALVCFSVGVLAFAASGSRAQDVATGRATPGNVAHGRQLYLTGCSNCHGDDARGIRSRGPNLHGAGAQSADWYLRTGRMPLAHPSDFPVRAPSVYNTRDRLDLVAYVGSLGGPAVPEVHPERGDLAEGKELFTNFCAGCHQVAAQGGILTPDVIAPSLQNHVTARDVAEVIRFGPYVMPKWSKATITPAETDSLSRYVLSTQHLENPGGWGLGNIGPIPEGLAAWGFGIVVLIAISRLIGTRTEQ